MTRRRLMQPVNLALFSICLFGAFPSGTGPFSDSVPPITAKIAISQSRKLPKSQAVQQFSLPDGASISFIENRGQFDSQVRYYAKSGNGMLWFTNRGIVFDITRGKEPQSGGYAQKKMERLVFNEELPARNDSAEITPCNPQPGTYNYFLGNDRSKWQTGIRSYSELIYRNVWPGIDVRFVAKRLDVEQEFLVHAGADPGLIRVSYTGINKLKIDRDGSLAAIMPFGDLLEKAPVIYQQNGSRVSRDGRFELAGEFSYVFRISSFDRSRDLVVDPTLLYSTYLGGTNTDGGNAIGADAAGNAYVAGITNSPDFPTTPDAFQATWPNNWSGFVIKFAPTGLPVYSTFLGPSAGIVGFNS